MPSRNILVIAVAVFVGLIAVYLANAYFSARQAQQEHFIEQNRMAKIVVAGQDLAFGSPLNGQNVRLANWPADSVPIGAFTSINDATKNRAALRPIVAGEPILASKVSGIDGRATIAANLPVGKLAFAVPVNDTTGVGGFVRPGDSVNVMLTRQIPGQNSGTADKMTDVLLEAVRVIGVDQTSDESKTQPAVGKTATLEVDTQGAQKLALATQVGTISLALRNVADQVTGNRSTVTARDLTPNHLFLAARETMPRPAARAPALALANYRHPDPPHRVPGPSMTIVRGVQTYPYEVHRGY